MVEDNECMKNGGNVHDKLKTWHQVKKGMEKHEHKFEYRFEDHGCHYLQCSHEGCNNSIAID